MACISNATKLVFQHDIKILCKNFTSSGMKLNKQEKLLDSSHLVLNLCKYFIRKT